MKNKTFYTSIFIMGLTLSPHTYAGSLSKKLSNAQEYISDKASSAKDQAYAYASSFKKWSKTSYTVLNAKKDKVSKFIKRKGKDTVHKSFDQMQKTYMILDPKSRKTIEYMFNHRDLVENIVIAGLENGKTMADIALDMAGVVPVVGSAAMVAKLVALDFMLPLLTAGLKTAFERDQANMASKKN